MNLLLQEVLVAVLVASCALFSAWRLMSLRLRLRCLDALGALPGAHRLRALAALKERTLAQLGSGCAGCGGAAAHTAQSRAATPGAIGRNQTPGALRR
jgi:hypothetical protein